MNDEMDDFASKQGVPNMFGLIQGPANAIGPGKRPLSAMTPTIVLKDGKLFLVLGSPGGPRIITTVANILMGVVDYGMNIQEAVNAPRFHQQWLPDVTYVEQGFPPEAVKKMSATSTVLLFAAIALVPFAISQLFTFAFYALPDTRTPALINIPVVALRIGVQIVLFVAFAAHFAAAGMMIGNAVSYLAAAFASAWLLRPRVGRIGMGAIMRTLGRVAVAALGAALVGLLVVSLLPGGDEPSWIRPSCSSWSAAW